MPLRQHQRQKYTQQCKHRSHRQIDATRYDDDPDTDAEDSVCADKARRVLDVGGTEELWIESRDKNAENRQQRQNSQLFPH